MASARPCAASPAGPRARHRARGGASPAPRPSLRARRTRAPAPSASFPARRRLPGSTAPPGPALPARRWRGGAGVRATCAGRTARPALGRALGRRANPWPGPQARRAEAGQSDDRFPGVAFQPPRFAHAPSSRPRGGAGTSAAAAADGAWTVPTVARPGAARPSGGEPRRRSRRLGLLTPAPPAPARSPAPRRAGGPPPSRPRPPCGRADRTPPPGPPPRRPWRCRRAW